MILVTKVVDFVSHFCYHYIVLVIRVHLVVDFFKT